MSVPTIAGKALKWAAGVVAVVVLLGALGILGLYVRGVLATRSVPVTTVEFIPPNEESLILMMVRKGTQAIELSQDPAQPDPQKAAPGGILHRDAHAKPHGCVMAQMTVDDTIPAELRQGVFSDPGRVYDAWVRFSNGTQADDTEADARGMAIKLMGVEGPKVLTPAEDREQGTQDFVMINYPTFFLGELEDYGRFFELQVAEKPVRYFFTPLWNPLAWPVRELFLALGAQRQKVLSPLATQYYSMSAYLFGPHNIKFSARPCRDELAERRFVRPLNMPEDPNFLRAALVDHLAADAGCFRFMVQLQDPTERMPIEDPTIEWKEAESPYRQVAILTVPSQEFDTPEQDEFCERLQFAPFHAVEDQRPLGRMNRVRHLVYREVSKQRHYANGWPISEPHGWCLDLTGETCDAGEPVPQGAPEL